MKMNSGKSPSACTLRFKIIIFTLTALLTAFIFIHSLMPASVSGEESEEVLDILTNILSFFGIDAGLSDHIVRKLAHFTEYSVWGALAFSCAYSFDRLKTHRLSPYVLGCGLFISLIDETIQLGVEGRSGQVTDIWVDFCGVLFGSAVMLLIFFFYRKIKARHEISKDSL